MKRIEVKICGIHDAALLVENAMKTEGDVTLYRGRYAIDAKSLMGVMAIDASQGVIIEYPNDVTKFEDFIKQFEIKRGE
jgi:phosphotransferase system HPr-like phosphotransfer protein